MFLIATHFCPRCRYYSTHAELKKIYDKENTSPLVPIGGLFYCLHEGVS